jgi:hypothetical protein
MITLSGETGLAQSLKNSMWLLGALCLYEIGARVVASGSTAMLWITNVAALLKHVKIFIFLDLSMGSIAMGGSLSNHDYAYRMGNNLE